MSEICAFVRRKKNIPKQNLPTERESTQNTFQ